MKHVDVLEIEIKFSIPSVDAILPRLLRAGFVLEHAPDQETSVLWDRDETLREQGQALRLRRYGSLAILTWKGARVEDARLKIRPEVETVVEDAEAMEGILRALGFAPCFTMVKTRSLWRRGALEACMDLTPFGSFMELEGSREAIQEATEELALGGFPVETRSYAVLFQEYDSCHGPSDDLQ